MNYDSDIASFGLPETADTAMPPAQEKMYTVTELNQNLRACIQANFPQKVWITGEVEDFRGYKKGNAAYFLLKDGTSALRMVWWSWNMHGELPPDFQNGVAVEIYGKVDVYAAKGECQISVESLRMKGEGAEMLKLKALREKLGSEGLFNPSRKKRLPPFPKKIGLITAEGAAAMGDFMRGLGNRQGDLLILFFPAVMQGKNAPASIARQLEYINYYSLCQVIVITRGGGSKEDLTAFNDEMLARTIAASQIPVISAVGHQQDFTICDDVADLRAMTPTDAAKCVVQEASRLRERIAYSRQQLFQLESYHISCAKNRLNMAASNRFMASPLDTLLQWRKSRIETILQTLQSYPQRLSASLALRVQAATGGIAKLLPAILPERKALAGDLAQRLAYISESKLKALRERLNRATDKLRLLGPQSILDRGYSIVFDAAGSLLKDAEGVQPGDMLKIRLAHGELTATVQNEKQDR